ncbi:hypothetical protein ABVK25_010813 [Lepraria finkii]|uniref:Initiation-specific alpha-1,6-mannosyltransferase n=1 Tax=Lepraria finkii TaxID=1340010 RepID=A0ABR4AUL6_9LECA
MAYQNLRQRRCFSFCVCTIFSIWSIRNLLLGHATPQRTTSISATSIPCKIWQSLLDQPRPDGLGEAIESWISLNKGCSYSLIGNDEADDLIRKHYSGEVVQAVFDTKCPISRAELLRYMLLAAEGGIYSDLDTIALKPIKDWIPHDLKPATRVVIGLDDFQLGDRQSQGSSPPPPPNPKLFCQRAFAASKGHPLLMKAIEAVALALRASRPSDLHPCKDVKLFDGPGIWANVIMESLSSAIETNVSHWNVTGSRHPRLFGDILILPIHNLGLVNVTQQV